jgi:transmembrane sensor
MSEFSERFTYLFHRYYGQLASPEEKAELMQLLDASVDDEELLSLAKEAWENQDTGQLLFTEEQSRNMLSKILGREIPVANIYSLTPVRRIPARRSPWLRYAAAVLLLVLLGAAADYLIHWKHERQEVVAASKITEQDIAPGGNKAVLTLGNGAKIILDSAHNGTLTQQGNATIVKTDSGQLSYRAGSEKLTDIVYNTLTTPRGGQFQLSLPDGTKVWLNSASSIRFPTAFSGSNREVEMTGEVYFEVVHDARRPFRVKAAGREIEDLGTHFNVNAYTDEQAMNTTLLEGSVKVGQLILSRAGQQARISSDGKVSLINDVNLEEVVAWKNGYFEFTDADIKAVMRQLSRWYAVTVVYGKHEEPALFTGQIGRNMTASQVFQVLSATGYHFTIRGDTIRVD